MVIMASGIVRGRIRTTTTATATATTTESRKMAAILQLMVDRDMQHWFTAYFFDIGHRCYGQK